ncbi:hypothetical protein SAMN05444579_107262 [Delftia tsuruhatensis]|nr:hypothetical protein SAMN05444579_107262 [Delftia tsuruhatensis]
MGRSPAHPCPGQCGRGACVLRAVRAFAAGASWPAGNLGPPAHQRPRYAARCRPRRRSSSVFASWCSSHKPCRLLGSLVPPSSRGTMWSSFSHSRTIPTLAHSTHSGASRLRSSRMRCKARPARRLMGAGLLRTHAFFGCLAQRPEPSCTRAPHPGCVQGRGAADGMVLPEWAGYGSGADGSAVEGRAPDSQDRTPCRLPRHAAPSAPGIAVMGRPGVAPPPWRRLVFITRTSASHGTPGIAARWSPKKSPAGSAPGGAGK